MLWITGYGPPQVDRIWLLVCYNKSPIYPILDVLKGDYKWMLKIEQT